MKTNLADLSRTYWDHLNRPGRPSSGPCPDVAALARCAMGELPRQDRDKIVEHAADCPTCAKALRRILDLSVQTERASIELAVSEARRKTAGSLNARPLGRRPAFWPAVAISSGILIFAAVIMLIPRSGSLTGTRGAAGANVVLVSPQSGTQSPKTGLVLRWENRSGAESYRVEIFDAAFRLIWRSGILTGTETGLPDEALGKLIPGARYYWMVTALAKGRRESKSKLSEFSIEK